MNVQTRPKPPQSLIEDLKREGGKPDPLAGRRQEAETWLRQLLVSFPALEQHIAMLRDLYDSPFRYPAARRDRRPRLSRPPAPPTRFAFTETLNQERIVDVFNGGVEVLTDGELAELLLNPFALYDLHDAINEVHPERWLAVMEEVGREMMRREGVSARGAAAPSLRLLPEKRTAANGGWFRRGTALWAGVGVGALAASVLFTGVWLLGGLGRHDGGRETGELRASVTPQYGDRKGAVKSLTGLKVESSFDGFVTVVLLFEERRPVVVPRFGSKQDFRVEAGSAVELILPDVAEDAAAVLALVTEQPADYPIWLLLDEKKFTAKETDEVERFLRTELEKKNYRRMTVVRTKLSPPGRN